MTAEDETGTYRAHVARGFVSMNGVYFLTSRDSVDVVSWLAIIDACLMAPHKSLQWVLRAREQKNTASAATTMEVRQANPK